MLSIFLLAGCCKDEATKDSDTVPITYSATYKVIDISDDFFALGTFKATYADKNGENQVINIEKSEIPFELTVDGLTEKSKLFFDLTYSPLADAPLTKEQYTFKRRVYLTVEGSNNRYASSSIIDKTVSVGKGNVSTYLDIVMKEKPLESTVKQVMSIE